MMPSDDKKQLAVKTDSKLGEFKNKYFAQFDQMVKDDKDFSQLNEAFQKSKTTLAGISRRENKTYSPDFIIEIESAIASLEAIINDPRKFIKENPLVVEVEKAKRITHHSIKHMAQHTENIASVGNDGKVDPKKILNMFIEDELKIYENRFIMTLVRRLQTFIELRYKYIMEHSDTRNSDIVTIKNEVKIGEVTYEVESKLRVVVPSDDEGHREANQDLLNRLIMLRKRTLFLATSRFMLEMRKASPVTDPVLQTNIMRLNYDYQNAYKLWMFISRYDVLGIEYKFKEMKNNFDEEYIKKLNYMALSSYLTINSEHQALPSPDTKVYFYKPKFASIELDLDLSDERIFAKGNPFKVINTKETEAQIEAKLRRQKEAEIRRLQKEEEKAKEKAKEKERRLLQKEAEKKKAELKRIADKKKAEEKKAKELEKKRLKEQQEAERLRIEKIKQEELKKLELAREQVAKLAQSRKSSKSQKK